MKVEITADYKKYIDKLGKEGTRIVFGSQEFFINWDLFNYQENNLSQNLEIIYIKEQEDEQLIASISKRLNASSHDIKRYDIFDKNTEYVIVGTHGITREMDIFMSTHWQVKIIYLVANSLSLFSLLLFKFLFSKSDREGDDILLNMLDPKIYETENEGLKIVNRKASPISKVKRLKRANSLSTIIHGNGNILYMGEMKICSKLEYQSDKDMISIVDFVNDQNYNSIFLASCFSLLLSGNSLSDDLMNSNVNNFVLYRGLKENGYAECSWFIILMRLGKSISEITKIINENIYERTIDFPKYIAFGSDLNLSKLTKFSPYDFIDGKLIRQPNYKDESKHFGSCRIPESMKDIHQYSICYSERVSWVFDKNMLYFMSEKGELPEILRFEKLNYRISSTGNLYYLLGLNGGLNKQQKSLISEIEAICQGISSQLYDSKVFSDVAQKVERKLKQLEKKRNKLYTDYLTEITKGKQTSLSPLSEKYSVHFFLRNSEVTKELLCPYCGYQLFEKVLVKNTDESYVRNILFCNNCGQIKDGGNLHFDKFDLEIKTKIKNNDLNIEVLCNQKSDKVWIISSMLEKEEVDNNVKIIEDYQNKVGFKYNLDNISNNNLIKIYAIYNGELYIFSRPFTLREESFYE